MEQLTKPTSTLKLPQAKNAISLTWTNLSYAVRLLTSFHLRQPAKVLLRQLTGHCTIHSLNGFLGPSGSGKTTLLNCLSGLRRPSGTVQLFDTTAGSSSVSSTKTLYFIEQHVEETILNQLTVGQILHYAFAFKNGRSISKEQRKVHLERIMSQLLLPSELLRRPFHRCSGGEQKRIAIAQELMSLAMPAFLFIDEPTTGLDTSAALQVVQCLSSLAENYPMTILASIHAPNEEILSCFTQLYVLAKGGVAIYCGKPEGIAAKLEEATGIKVPDEQPPIEALLKVACNGAEDEVALKLSSKCQDQENSSSTTNSTTLLTTFQHSFFSLEHLFLQLTRLGHYQFIVNWSSFLGTLLQSFLLFVLVVSFFPSGMAEITQCFPIEEKSSVNGTTLLPVCSKESLDQGILKRENSAFLAYSFVFSSTNFVIFATTFYGPILKVFQSEHRNNWYSLGVFYISSTIISLLETASLSLVISTAIYFLSGQHGADGYSVHPLRLTYFTLSWLLLSVYCQSIGSFHALLFAGHQDVALFLSLLACSEITLMNNIVVNLDNSGIGLLILLSDLVGSKDIGKLFLYVIYGLDRCPEGTFEKDIKGYNVEEGDIHLYIGRVLGIIAFLKLLGFLFLYTKYSTSWWKKTVALPELDKLPTITEYSEPNLVAESNPSPVVLSNVPESKQMMVAFHSLTLYTSNSIYELATENTSGSCILNNLHGTLHFGNLVGLMGPSGAGKTSLLRVLNGQLKNRLDATSQFFLSSSTFISTCFINQQVSGHLASGLTALQSLIYASKLKNVGQSVNHSQVAMNILKQLDLEAISSTRVERCSGGERKRLALGLELTATCLPNLIIIDEPTSGLDSNSAEIVISCLKKLVSQHRNSLTIVASLHQPNTEILKQIDWLYVLAKGGIRVFEGPPRDVPAFLQKVTHNSVVNNTQKVAYPVEQLIRYCNLDSSDRQIGQMVEESDRKQSNVNMSTLCLVQDGIPLNRCRFTLEASFTLATRYLARIRNHLWKKWLWDFLILIFFSLFLRVIFPASIALPAGCMNIETDDLSGAALDASCTGNAYEESQKLEVVLNNYRYVFHLSASFLFFIMFNCSLDLSEEFYGQFGNEHRNGWYSTGAFYLQHSLIGTIPLLIMILTHSYISNIYSQVLPSLYWNMVAILLLGALAYQGIGHLIGILSEGSFLSQVAYLFTVYIIFTMLSNFFITIAKMNSVYQFVANFCTPRYVFEGLLLLQYGFGRCGPREIQPILYSLNLEDADYSTIILALIGNILFYRLLAVAVILFKTRQPVNRKKRAARLIQFRSDLTSNCIISGLDRSETTFEIKVRK